MLPSFYVFLGEMPLNLNGKVDRNALPSVDYSRDLQDVDLPVNELEEQLLSIWENVFKEKNIGVNDDFFTLGGDSLMAMDLLFGIEKLFSRKIPLAIILKASTIREQAEILEKYDSTKTIPVIPIKETGTKPPIFWIPSGFGADLFVQRIAQYLDADQPLYLLPAIDTSPDGFFMVEDLARSYADKIRQFFPDGPYYLVGHSGGGIKACATANELMRFGGQIGWVGMLDSVPPHISAASLMESFQLFFYTMPSLGFVRSIKDLGRNLFVRLSMMFLEIPFVKADVLRKKKIPVIKSLPVRESSYVKVFFSHTFYKPAPFSFDLILFKAVGVLRYTMRDHMPGWKDYAAKGLKTIDVPGDHVSMMDEPNIAVLARKICQQISD
jgi:thioesterase domain-containing protein/acyl carrier protein